MPSTGKEFFDQFAVSNQGITDLRELLFLSVLQFGSINETMDVLTGVVPGSRLGGVGELEPVGRPSNGCAPDWKSSKIGTLEKTWNLGAYEIAESICYADLEQTMVQFAMRTGTDRADLTGTDYIDAIVEPRLRLAMEKMIWRLFWFGDTAAANVNIVDGVNTGGNITSGVDPTLFTVTDGLFKRLLAITAANAEQRVVISANAQATKAAQLDALKATGVATSIFDRLVYDAPMKLRQKSDKILLVTQTLADALAIDVKANNKGSDLQWESLFDGFITATKYNGQTILALPIWDEMIRAFEDTGTKWNKPHRAVLASKNTLKGGVNSSNMIADLQIFFSQKDQTNYLLAKDKVGTLTWEDELVMFAY
ncbi:MAG: hypothetical protein LBP72_08050 [Dysgonamonadaceae bacterium]|jgi:hypothetical protein|nr:hypothetical protein [Dysgonamonadaceae bacterium]